MGNAKGIAEKHSSFVIISRLYYNFLPAFLFHITADIIFSAFLFASCFLHSRSESIVCTQYYGTKEISLFKFSFFFFAAAAFTLVCLTIKLAQYNSYGVNWRYPLLSYFFLSLPFPSFSFSLLCLF